MTTAWNQILLLISFLFVVAHVLPGTMDLSYATQKFWTFLFLFLSLIPYLISLLQIFKSSTPPSPAYQLAHLAYFIFLATLIIARVIIHRHPIYHEPSKLPLPPLPMEL